MTAANTASTSEPEPKGRRTLSQSDVPAYTLKDALRVAEAIRDQFAKESTTPLNLAVALDIAPTGTVYKMLSGSAVAYGLTEGAAQAASISLTDLGRRIVAPVEEGDEVAAMREAVLKPRVIREFLQKYDGSSLPLPNIALNVIEQMNVPENARQRAYDMIIRNAEDLGLLIELKGKKYVRLDTTGANPQSGNRESVGGGESADNVIPYPAATEVEYADEVIPDLPARQVTDPTTNNRVFITHGKNYKVVEQIQKILRFGKFEAIVSVENQTLAKPIPDKVMDDMRSCSAAIVHVGAERKLLDAEGNEHTEINPNVLIEVGAAMALYERRFVLLVERGVVLPSNLHGLCEVRYEGEQLDHDATMKLLEAFNNFR
jgi:predicted nucleotide-binding protein